MCILHNTTHSTLPMAVAQDPVGDVTQFVTRFEDQFGASHAPLPRTSYSQTVEQAKSELRFLLVYLHSWEREEWEEYAR